MEEHLQRPGKRHAADDAQGDCVPATAAPPASTDDEGEDVPVANGGCDGAGHQHRAHKRSTHAHHTDTEDSSEAHQTTNITAAGESEGDHAEGCAAVFDDAEAATRAFNDAVQRLKDLRAQGGDVTW